MKLWYKSYTVWANIVAGALTFAAVVAQNVTGQDLINPGVQGAVATVVLALLNLILRFRTTEAITT